jgi:multidrug efflux pump subunit AcrA (membrane-fusion protein)
MFRLRTSPRDVEFVNPTIRGMTGCSPPSLDYPAQPVAVPNESARGAIITGLMVLAAFFIGLGGWAAIAPLNGAVVATGVIKVEGNRKTIQHLDGGIVKELRIKEGDRIEIGQTVIVLEETQARADKVMDIVPSENRLVAEANVNVDDIHEVHPGMRAEMHFTAYKQRVIPIIHGDIADVSADRLTDKRTGTPYYIALVRADENELAASKEVVLTAGMAVTVMIPTKERTALDYLLGPVMASFDQSFRQK